MAQAPQKLTITPRTIDTGADVINTHHVTSARFGAAYPFRVAGLALLALAAALIVTQVIFGGEDSFSLKAGGSRYLWMAFAAAGVGSFLTIFARRQLVIRTLDGQRLTLSAGDEQASMAAISQIRDAIEASGTRLAVAQHLDHERSQAVPLAAAPGDVAQDHAKAQGAIIRQLPATGSSGPAAGRAIAAGEQRAALPIATQPLAASRRPEGYLNGHAAPSQGTPGHSGPGPLEGGGFGLPPADAASAPARRQLSEYVPPRNQPGNPLDRPQGTRADGLPFTDPAAAVAGDPRAMHQREPLALPSAGPVLRQDPVADLHQLIEHVRRADVQHKDALVDLLKVVDDHYRGRATREEALAHWRSFADYVIQYLGNVDGLIGLTERFGRHMQLR